MVRDKVAAIALAALLIGATADAQELQLLDFWSPQCGPCMQMKPIMHSYEQAGYPIRQVDTTRESQLARQYNVTSIPCFVMLVNGQETERQVGAMSSGDVHQMFERGKDELRRRKGVRNVSPDAAIPGPQQVAARSDAAGPAQMPGDQMWPPKSSVPVEPVAAVAGGAPAASAAAGNASGVDPASHAALLSATVRLIIEDSQGRSFGTGTVVDTRSGEALVVTCAHLFRETQGKAPVKADLFEATGSTARVAGHATGQVLSFDLTRDVALVSLRLDRPVATAKVAPPSTTVARFDRMISIGCSNGQDPTVMETRVNSLDRYQGPPNIETSGAPTIGRSGGGLFNGKGELVGVCNNADPEGNEGIYAAVESVHEQLDRLGLKDIYSKPGAAAAAPNAVGSADPQAKTQVVRGQEPPITPPTTGSPRNLSETEQAALEEIMKRGVSSEVICIVRPKDAGGQSEVIHIENVSPEFIQALRQGNGAVKR